MASLEVIGEQIEAVARCMHEDPGNQKILDICTAKLVEIREELDREFVRLGLPVPPPRSPLG